MADFLDFLPLTQETIETIRARLDLDANAGVEPSDAGYMDLTEGGFYFDVTQPSVLEAERLWDFLSTEVVAAMFVQSAWGPYLDEHGEMLGVERKDESFADGEVRFTGVDGTYLPTGTQVAQPATDPDGDPVVFETTAEAIIGDPDDPTVPVPTYLSPGETTVPVRAVEAGPAGNVAAGNVNQILTAIDGANAVSNVVGMSSGADVESDESYQKRLLLEWRSPGSAGNIADYEKWALAYPGVGYVTVNPVFNGEWTVQVVVADASRNPVSGAVKDGLQALLDPGVGTGAGLAPIGAAVTVDTITSFTVPISAEVDFAPGYSLDGDSGSIALRDAINAAIIEYVDGLGPGDDVIRAKVESLFFRIQGIDDVRNVLINGAAQNFAIGPTMVASTIGSSIVLAEF